MMKLQNIKVRKNILSLIHIRVRLKFNLIFKFESRLQ